MSEDYEAGKKADELLRTGRRVLLQTAGIKENEILNLGDLATAPPEKLIELVRRETLAVVLRMKHTQVTTFRTKKRRRTK